MEPSSKKCVAAFDFQKTLLCPKAEETYFKSKLKCFVFTVVEQVARKEYTYFWDQTTARNGMVEAANCLFKFLEGKVNDGFVEFTFYCHNHFRSAIICAMFQHALVKFQVKILLKFDAQLESISCCNLIDYVWGCATEIFSPAQWVEAILLQDPSHQLYVMERENFKDFKEVVENCNDWSKVIMSKVQAISFENYMVQIQYQSGEEVISICLDFPGKRVQLETLILHTAYPSRLPLSKIISDDLRLMCTHGIIPENHLPFYESLFMDSEVADLPDQMDV